MKKSREPYILCKTFISDNGIDRVFSPILEKEEYQRRTSLLKKSCIHFMREWERVCEKKW